MHAPAIQGFGGLLPPRGPSPTAVPATVEGREQTFFVKALRAEARRGAAVWRNLPVGGSLLRLLRVGDDGSSRKSADKFLNVTYTVLHCWYSVLVTSVPDLPSRPDNT